MSVSKLLNARYCNYLLKLRNSHSAAATSEIQSLTRQDAKVTKNITGVTVASVENYSPITHVSVLVKSGSRYETEQNIGISHCLRNCSCLSTKTNTAFSITRNLELLGAKLDVSTTREYLVYTLQCARDDIGSGLEILSDVTSQQLFKAWEVRDAAPKMNIDLAILEKKPEAVLMESLHKAAFRGGLSNSLYTLPYMVGRHSSEMLNEFVKANYTTSTIAVAGLSVGHDDLENFVTKSYSLLSNIPSGNGASKFGGSEIRVERDLPFTQAAIVAEGAGLSNAKEALSLGVLQCLLGTGGQHRHSSGQFSKLGEAAAKQTSNEFSVSCLNINYSDTGLFGVYVAGHPNDMKPLVKAIVSQMREATKNFTDETLQAAKHMLKSKMAIERDSTENLLQDLAVEAINFGRFRDTKELEKAIDALTAADISAVANKVMKTKPAMAAIGQLHNTPHLDELI